MDHLRGDDPGEVVAVVATQHLGPGEEVRRHVSFAHREVRQEALAGLGGGHPGAVADAAHAQAFHHEGVAVLGEALVGATAARIGGDGKTRIERLETLRGERAGSREEAKQ